MNKFYKETINGSKIEREFSIYELEGSFINVESRLKLFCEGIVNPIILMNKEKFTVTVWGYVLENF